VRTLTIAATHALNPEELDDLRKDELGRSLSCYYWEKDFTVIEKVLWKVDPAFVVDRSGAVRQWHVLLRSLPADCKLRVRTPDGNEVLVGRPSGSGTLHFSLMFDDATGPDELSMEFERPEGAAAAALEMSVRQTLYVLRSSLPVQGDVASILLNGSLRHPRLEVASERQSLKWDLGVALAPQLLAVADRANGGEAPGGEIVHKGSRVGNVGSVTIARALEGLLELVGHPRALRASRVKGQAGGVLRPDGLGRCDLRCQPVRRRRGGPDSFGPLVVR
jgi:hypothetical protein